MTRVSLSEAFLVRYIYPGAPRVTSATWRPSTKLAGPLTWVLGSPTVKYGARYFITPMNMKYGQTLHCNPIMFHAKLKKTTKTVFIVLSSSCECLLVLNHSIKMMSNPIVWLERFYYSLSLSRLSESAAVLKLQEYSHTFHKVTPHMCIICRMRNACLCWLLLFVVGIIRG